MWACKTRVAREAAVKIYELFIIQSTQSFHKVVWLYAPGVTYPGAAALTNAPRVRAGRPLPRAAWAATADTAAAAANAPLDYNTHTIKNPTVHMTALMWLLTPVLMNYPTLWLMTVDVIDL